MIALGCQANARTKFYNIFLFDLSSMLRSNWMECLLVNKNPELGCIKLYKNNTIFQHTQEKRASSSPKKPSIESKYCFRACAKVYIINLTNTSNQLPKRRCYNSHRPFHLQWQNHVTKTRCFHLIFFHLNGTLFQLKGVGPPLVEPKLACNSWGFPGYFKKISQTVRFEQGKESHNKILEPIHRSESKLSIFLDYFENSFSHFKTTIWGDRPSLLIHPESVDPPKAEIILKKVVQKSELPIWKSTAFSWRRWTIEASIWVVTSEKTVRKHPVFSKTLGTWFSFHLRVEAWCFWRRKVPWPIGCLISHFNHCSGCDVVSNSS